MKNRFHSSNATIKDVAKAAKKSIATVSRVYNFPDKVSETTRAEILRIANSLNYSPQHAARALTLQRTNVIGVILPDLGGEFFSELIRNIDRVAWEHGFHIMISASHSHRNEADLLLQLMGQGWVDGLIVMVPVLGKISATLLPKVNIPMVLLNLPEEHDPFIHINVDNYRGAYLITRHLIGHAYSPIAMIRGPVGNYDADMREKGFLTALAEDNHRLELDDSNYIERGDFNRRSGYLAMIRLLSLPVPPRAVFAANDEMAIGAFNAVQQHGLRIPEQVAIVGFDDIEVTYCIRPSLTTVHLPITELGTTAAEKLIAAILNPDDNAKGQHIVLPTGLVIRESCGCTNPGRFGITEEGR